MKLRRQITEYNVSRLGLISIQTRLSEQHLMGWQAVETQGSSSQGIICSTADPVGVPHGIASDVFSALLTIAAIRAEDGISSSSEIVITAAGIAKHANLKVHGRHYEAIDQALTSLASTKYKVFAKWTDPMTRTSRDATFSIIDFLATNEQEHLFNKSQVQKDYVLRLNQEIVRSVEGSLVLAINPSILKSLSSPGARAVYRMLESLRRDPEDVARASSKLTLSAAALAESTRLLSPRQNASHQLRLLDSAFSALVKAGYLRSYETLGRGAQSHVQFHFLDDVVATNTEARRLLLSAGITGRNAESLAIAHSVEEIGCAIWVVEHKTSRDSTIRNPAGMIVKTLKDGTARDMMQQYRDRNLKVKVSAVSSPQQKGSAKKIEADREFPPASPEQAAYAILQGLLNNKKVTTEQHEQLKHLISDGVLSMHDMGRLITLNAENVQKIIGKWLATESP